MYNRLTQIAGITEFVFLVCMPSKNASIKHRWNTVKFSELHPCQEEDGAGTRSLRGFLHRFLAYAEVGCSSMSYPVWEPSIWTGFCCLYASHDHGPHLWRSQEHDNKGEGPTVNLSNTENSGRSCWRFLTPKQSLWLRVLIKNHFSSRKVMM